MTAIRRLGPADEQALLAAGRLFDEPPRADATRAFLADPARHLLLAEVEGQPAGFVSGIEIVHPDKDTEMLLYELGVDEPFRRRGIGRALIAALERLARERGCHAMFVLVDDDDEPALATYASAGGRVASKPVLVEWALQAERTAG